MPLIDYDLALLFQPMLMLGISIGVAFNVMFADWMVTVLLIILFMGTATKALMKGIDTWKNETVMKKVQTSICAAFRFEGKQRHRNKQKMAEKDPEKKFHSIMDKLFYAPPKSTLNASTSNESQLSRSKKRLNPETALALVEPQKRGRVTVEGTPLCRPWDRGDLMRRVATFKSMTWFAKPKLVSAVNCARRGWTNLETDIIGCEVCGARLLFTTPSSWSHQQVEKAALVFSLKLDNGHKLLCPWTDNACEERLAEFPPITPPVLVEKLNERSAALLQLLALPIISSSAIESMKSRCPQLEEFLRQSPVAECDNQLDTISPAESLGDDDGATAHLYYQAQKLISLCGWEPRSLPYVVDCKERPKQLVKDAAMENSSLNGHNPMISVHSSATDESVEARENFGALSGLNADPNSVVLDCRLCGASVGLWAFSTVARPVELFRLIGHSESDSRKNSGQASGRENSERGGVASSVSSHMLSSTCRVSDFKMTIAGGPPPTKQNYKATISLPVIGRNLRARLSYDSEFRARTSDKNISQLEGMGLSKSTTEDHGQCSYGNGEQSSCLNLGVSGKGDEKNNSHSSLDGTVVIEEGAFPETSRPDSVVECPTLSMLDTVQASDQNGGLPENANTDAQTVGSLSSEIRDLVSVSSVPDPGSQVKANEGRVQTPTQNQLVVYGTGKDPKQLSLEKATDFDPIRQHRHFCPWILPTNSGLPGWQLTLSALHRQQECSQPMTDSPSSASMIKVDDPIASVRKLFTSPSPKRTKPITELN